MLRMLRMLRGFFAGYEGNSPLPEEDLIMYQRNTPQGNVTTEYSGKIVTLLPAITSVAHQRDSNNDRQGRKA